MTDKKEESTEIKTSKKPKLSIPKKKVLFGFLFIAVAAVAVVMTLKYNDLRKNPNKVSQEEQKSLLTKVGKLIELPSGEQPSIATVSDKEKLKEQAFFNKAENGDTLLIYTTAKKAILYREKTDKVIEVAPIAIDATQAGTQAQPAPAPSGDKKQ